MWLDPLEERVALGSVGVTTALSSPQQCIIGAGLAVRNPNHLSSLTMELGVPPNLLHPRVEDMK